MVPTSASEVLKNHVVFELEGIDRLYLNGYVPGLQHPGGFVTFTRFHRKLPIVSTAAVAPMTKTFVKKIEDFIHDNGLDLITFKGPGQKDDIAQQYLARADFTEGVLFVGKAQERANVPRTVKRRDRKTGQSWPWVVWGSAMVNYYYFYILDRDFGPLFIKFCSYFPYSVKLCLNGHEWLKQQLAHRRIRFEALDNGLLSCNDPEAAQRLADQLDAQRIDAVFRKWLARLPHPFAPKDRRAGYRYLLSIWQAEFSLTQVLDRPLSGRILFEELIRENIDLGRPDRIQLIFQRRMPPRRTPASFRTRVITDGVVPSLRVQYKRTKVKQYFKEGRGLRTETTINDTKDFGIGRRLHNLPLLREIGFKANRRLLDVQTLSQDCTIGEDRFASLHRGLVRDGQRVSALRFGDPRVMVLMSALVLFRLVQTGFTNRELREHTARLLGHDPAQIKPGRMTYDLRRLRLHGLIERVTGTRRYRVTEDGLRVALLYHRLQARVFRPVLSCTRGRPPDAPAPASRGGPTPLHRLSAAMDRFIDSVHLRATG